jgi:hypothetical protein
MTSKRILLQRRSDKDVQIEIVFRKLTALVRTLWTAGYHWQVEAYECDMKQPPIAIGWVLDVSPGRPVNMAPEDDPYDPDLECVRVFRGYEEGDIAQAVIEAARLRWPNLRVQEGTSEEENKWIKASKKLKKGKWAVLQAARS